MTEPLTVIKVTFEDTTLHTRIRAIYGADEIYGVFKSFDIFDENNILIDSYIPEISPKVMVYIMDDLENRTGNLFTDKHEVLKGHLMIHHDSQCTLYFEKLTTYRCDTCNNLLVLEEGGICEACNKIFEFTKSALKATPPLSMRTDTP